MAETSHPSSGGIELQVDGKPVRLPPDTTLEGPRSITEGMEIVLRYGKGGDNDVDFAMDLAEQVTSGRNVHLVRNENRKASRSGTRKEPHPARKYRLVTPRNIPLQTPDEEAMTDIGEPPRGITFGSECEVIQHFLVEPAD